MLETKLSGERINTRKSRLQQAGYLEQWKLRAFELFTRNILGFRVSFKAAIRISKVVIKVLCCAQLKGGQVRPLARGVFPIFPSHGLKVITTCHVLALHALCIYLCSINFLNSFIDYLFFRTIISLARKYFRFAKQFHIECKKSLCIWMTGVEDLRVKEIKSTNKMLNIRCHFNIDIHDHFLRRAFNVYTHV